MNDTPPSAAERLRAPAICLVAYGACSALLEFAALVNKLLGNPLQRRLAEFLSERGIDTTAFDSDSLSGGLLFGASFLMNIVLSALQLALSLFIGWAGLQMLRRRHHAACMGAAIAACLPCSACCCLGLPLGIWVLVVLNREDVRQSFSES
ncbi:MAG: hypothetical protein FJ299_15900 [Planctomycetes bacterium]|nr:hypothetical protein [Planctomycetota bacterium]